MVYDSVGAYCKSSFPYLVGACKPATVISHISRGYEIKLLTGSVDRIANAMACIKLYNNKFL